LTGKKSVKSGDTVVVHCPKCDKVDQIRVTQEHIENIKISGIAQVAVDHGDHVCLISFDRWGSIRGNYIYSKAQRGKKTPFGNIQLVKITRDKENFLGDIFTLYLINYTERTMEVFGKEDAELEKTILRLVQLSLRIEQTFGLKYSFMRIEKEDKILLIAYGLDTISILVLREKISEDEEKDLLYWMLDNLKK